MTKKEIDQLNQEWKEVLHNITSLDQLNQIEILYLGRKAGKLTMLLRGLKDLSDADKKIIAPELQKLKTEIETELHNRRSSLQATSYKLQAQPDPTLPGITPRMGHYNPLTLVRRNVEEVFRSMGFLVVDGPQLESEFYNFDALNIPSWHPAREMWDTFYVENPNSPAGEPKNRRTEESKNRLLLRTHTSSMQVRVMQNYKLPIRAIMPGTVYRNEATDARHEKAFLNVEGLMVDTGISLQHLVSVSRTFLKKILGADVEFRFRPGYFPFTEPSVEMDISCLICKAKGCAVCKKTGWLEFMGAGVTHPNVLKAGGIDPKKYSGFAFGFGLDRLAMLKYGINDVRLFRSQDLRFIRQF